MIASCHLTRSGMASWPSGMAAEQRPPPPGAAAKQWPARAGGKQQSRAGARLWCSEEGEEAGGQGLCGGGWGETGKRGREGGGGWVGREGRGERGGGRWRGAGARLSGQRARASRRDGGEGRGLGGGGERREEREGEGEGEGGQNVTRGYVLCKT
ncbi:hypothetical protein Scep_028720 [Stephania cephalantha]|uniref:Uncharacterized protein n=1 Tax=Stephania cephalantha TaxID=152367 RepID=A0AAP0HID7_9MAGN